MMTISPSAVHSTKQSSYCWQKATNSSSVMGPRLGFRITGAIDSKSSTTNCMSPVYCGEYCTIQSRGDSFAADMRRFLTRTGDLTGDCNTDLFCGSRCWGRPDCAFDWELHCDHSGKANA